MRTPSLWLVGLASACVALASAAEEGEVIGWSTTKQGCSDGSKQTLVFVYDDFSLVDLSKGLGAYREDVSTECKACQFSQLAEYAQSKATSQCTELPVNAPANVDGMDVKAVIAAARSGSGVHVINMGCSLNHASPMQDTVIAEALKEAERASGGDLSFFMTGKALSRSGRSLQAALVPLTIRMAPDTFIGLVVLVLSISMLVFFLCCCMDGITPQNKYAKQYPLRGKEQN